MSKSVRQQIEDVIERAGEQAYLLFHYRTHYKDGSVSPWCDAPSNKFLLDNCSTTQVVLKECVDE